MAQDGTYSLEVVEQLRQARPQAAIIWFCNLDFALRAYQYNVLWFGKKPITPSAVQKAFGRFIRTG